MSQPQSLALHFSGGPRSQDLLQLDDRDRQRFSDVVESSFAVSTRQQFFVWTQSSLHGLVPHEILLCGVRENFGRPMVMHRFCATRYFRDEQFAAVAHPVTGLAPLLLAVGEQLQTATVLCPPEVASPHYDALLRQVDDNELKNLAGHIVVGVSGQADALYAFGRIDGGPGRRTLVMLEMLTPHVHRTFLRVLAAERSESRAPVEAAPQLITRRQSQILNLVKDGKTNAEIATVLGCSQWTVKNHVQSILRRLESSSRTHAITRAISLGILAAD